MRTKVLQFSYLKMKRQVYRRNSPSVLGIMWERMLWGSLFRSQTRLACCSLIEGLRVVFTVLPLMEELKLAVVHLRSPIGMVRLTWRDLKRRLIMTRLSSCLSTNRDMESRPMKPVLLSLRIQKNWTSSRMSNTRKRLELMFASIWIRLTSLFNSMSQPMRYPSA